MNGLLWILLLCCYGNNNGCGCANKRVSVVENDCCGEREKSTCSLKERENVWTPYMSNASDRDKDCGCEHNY